MKTIPMTPEQEKIILDTCRGGKSGREAAKFAKVSPSSVSNVLRRNNIKTAVGRRPSCDLDHSAFDVITPISAYWSGFLFADGSIVDYKDGAPQLILELAIKDRAHIEKFRNFLKSTHAISEILHKKSEHDIVKTGDRKSCAFRVRSKQLVASLRSLGMIGKSPDRIPTRELEDSADFWRGCVDGDGTVRINDDLRHNYKYANIMLYGHIPLLERFQAFLLRRGIVANITDTASGIYQIRLMGHPALMLVKLLYTNAVEALDRKLASANEIMKTFEQT